MPWASGMPWLSIEMQVVGVSHTGTPIRRAVCNGCAEWERDCVCHQEMRTRSIVEVKEDA